MSKIDIVSTVSKKKQEKDKCILNRQKPKIKHPRRKKAPTEITQAFNDPLQLIRNYHNRKKNISTEVQCHPGRIFSTNKTGERVEIV